MFALFGVLALLAQAQQLGASLYIAPLQDSPHAGSNFTLTVKVDSLAQPINAISGKIKFDKERLEIINISKIGSVINLWVEEPRFSNVQGTLNFQGGVPNPGFVGSGGTILHAIFRARAPGAAVVSWNGGEILANDGKGTNVLTSLQNLDFFIEEALQRLPIQEGIFEGNFLVVSNIVLISIILLFIFGFIINFALRFHDKRYHHAHQNENNHPIDDDISKNW